MTAYATGFAPGERVRGTMFSSPIDLGVKPADDTGRVDFTWIVPVGITIGLHTVEFAGEISGTVSAQFTVQAPPQAGTPGLSRTGAGVSPAAVLVTFLLIGLGAGLLRARRHLRTT